MLRDLTIMIVKFWSYGDLCAGLQETWCCILTPVVLRVRLSQGISSIICVFVSVTTFASSQYGMYYLNLSIYIHSEIQE
jgi:hypothetical protein